MQRQYSLAADASHNFLFPTTKLSHISTRKAEWYKIWTCCRQCLLVHFFFSESSIRKPRFQSLETTWQKWCGALSCWKTIVVFLRLQCVGKQRVKPVKINVSLNGVLCGKETLNSEATRMFDAAGLYHWFDTYNITILTGAKWSYAYESNSFRKS
jgi:hypothetical protein